MLCNFLISYKNYGLSVGSMVAGWDKRGPQLYYVDSDAMRLKAEFGFSVGSGSTFAYGVLDTEYRRDLTIEDAISLAKRAIYHATHRDAYSGGYVNGTYFGVTIYKIIKKYYFFFYMYIKYKIKSVSYCSKGMAPN
ncbi:hypothetical protein RFI_10580 [Reticulomyxa filosa]|uniref:proteasome endopeptidase complex n=1 Tax=Reticulomyxa filosa TaxID=46433 RepID=X6NMD4_RETFI|nr:hypothetical protein RFI_10580 [Reticulomyxa filosa]|eukprot:ETO26557.1 hypothetical protein RFI_10580 [Reticulomyxa filosa]